jgi:hypothetical protein
MAALVNPLYEAFLPPGYKVIAGPPAPLPLPTSVSTPTPTKKPAPVKPVSINPQVALDKDRALGQYAFNLIEVIAKDYATQISGWKTAFGEVLAAYATAIEQRNETLKLAQAEREAEAALAAFVFSLVTAGAMRFLGAYVQYKLVPSSTRIPYTYKFTGFTPGGGLPEMTKVTFAPVENFSKLQAAAFGGLTQDAGNKLLPSIFPKVSKPATTSFDTWAGVENLRADFIKLVEDSAAVVLQQFGEVQRWLNQERAFGRAWSSVSNEDTELARSKIRDHIDLLRKKWSSEWEFFGKSPSKISRDLLAQSYERALWAQYLIEVTRAADARGDLSWIKVNFATINYGGAALAKDTDFDIPKIIEKSVVNRLKELNIVFAETIKGVMAQSIRSEMGAPKPSAKVEGAVDSIYEAKALANWASEYLGQTATQGQTRFFPVTAARTLSPL